MELNGNEKTTREWYKSKQWMRKQNELEKATRKKRKKDEKKHSLMRNDCIFACLWNTYLPDQVQTKQKEEEEEKEKLNKTVQHNILILRVNKHYFSFFSFFNIFFF